MKQGFKIPENETPLTERQKKMINDLYTIIKDKSLYDVRKTIKVLEYNLDMKSKII